MNKYGFWMIWLLLVVNCWPVQASQPPASPPPSPILSVPQETASPAAARAALHEQAVELARSQNFSAALTILDKLYQDQPADLPVAYDYITVLNWAGHYHSAIIIYQTLPSADIPAYVLRSVGGAYFQQGQYANAKDIYKILETQGDPQAKLWQAECLTQLDDTAAAQTLYQELLLDNPQDSTVYISRATLASRQQNFSQAIADLELALQYLSDTADEKQLQDIQAALAAALINQGNPERALTILNPYILNHTASTGMQGNDVLALRSSGQYESAVQAAANFWPKIKAAPTFALRAWAESYIQLKQPRQAITLYQEILTRQPQDDGAQLGLAFSHLLSGERKLGLSLYDQFLASQPNNTTLIERDAAALLATGHQQAGKALFELLIRHKPHDSSLKEQYAATLRSNGQLRAAFHQYHKLPAAEAGATGMVRTALALEDYRLAEHSLQELRALTPSHSTQLALDGLYNSRRLGEAAVHFGYSNSYKELQTRYWDVDSEQHLGGNYWLLAGFNRTNVKDLTAGEQHSLDQQSFGIRYHDIAKDISLRYAANQGNSSFSSYSLNSDWYLNDQTTLSLSLDRSPLLDVQALTEQNGGPVMETAYRLNYFRILGPREDFTIALDHSQLSDGNQTIGYQLNHTFTVFDQDEQALNRLLYWNRTYFNQQDQVYESPSLRESLGVGYVYKYSFDNNSYLTNRLMLNWEHDAPDPLAFDPYIRIEYGRDISPSHSFSLGFEYGLHSDNVTGSQLRYSYRQIDGLYRITW